MKIKVTALAPPAKPKVAVRSQNIVMDGERVGTLHADNERNTNVEGFLKYFEDNFEPELRPSDKRFRQILTKLKVPRTFDFLWVDRLIVSPKHRGKGVAGKALNWFKKQRPLLTALNVGAVPGARMNRLERLAAYRKMGFRIFYVGPWAYAFRVT